MIETSKLSSGFPRQINRLDAGAGVEHFGAESAESVVGQHEICEFGVLREGPSIDELDVQIARKVDFRYVLVLFEGIDVDVADVLVGRS